MPSAAAAECDERQEADAVNDLVFLQVADRLYPETSKQATEGSSKDLEQQDSAGDVEEDDIEAQIAKELEDLQPAVDPETGKKKMRFQSARTDTECCESNASYSVITLLILQLFQ